MCSSLGPVSRFSKRRQVVPARSLPSAYSSKLDADYGICRITNDGLGPRLDANVKGATKNYCFHRHDGLVKNDVQILIGIFFVFQKSICCQGSLYTQCCSCLEPSMPAFRFDLSEDTKLSSIERSGMNASSIRSRNSSTFYMYIGLSKFPCQGIIVRLLLRLLLITERSRAVWRQNSRLSGIASRSGTFSSSSKVMFQDG